MTRLPRSVDELRGLRAARWIRESKREQEDRFGPDAQRRRQDDAIAAHGLVDTGIAWSVAHSGFRKAGRNDVSRLAKSAWWAQMLEAAGRDFDVLLVGYVSRFARDAETLLTTRRRLHAAGAVALFVADRLLSSDEDQWEQFAREAVEAEAYSRRMGKRIREGYEERRRRFADPGGRPPFGFHRVGADRLLEPDPAKAAEVLRIFELAAARQTDRDVAARTGLSIHVIRTTLRSSLYAGRLPDGSSTRFPAVVPPELWHRAQEVRARRRTRDGRPAVKTPYALSMLHCAACGRHLIGDVGRYRHPDLCEPFRAAVIQPGRRRRGQHRDIRGASYPAAMYERAIGEVLARVSLGADVVAAVVADRGPALDEVAIARVERERDAALARYRRDRDAERLAAAMARLDADELVARSTPAPKLAAGEAVEYLRDLSRWWAEAKASRRALAEYLFERVEVLGLRQVTITPSAAAIQRGLAEAFGSGSGGYGRGGGSGRTGTRLIVRLAPGVATRVRIVLPRRAEPRLLEASA